MIRPVSARPPWPGPASAWRRGGDGTHVPLTCTRMTASKSAHRHVPDRAVAHDAGVVHEDVELARSVDRLLHHRAGGVVVGDVGVVGHRLAAPLLDDLHGQIGVVARPLAADRPPDVVDDDPGALLGQLHRVAPPDAVAGAGDDGDLAVEQAHYVSFRNVRRPNTGPRSSCLSDLARRVAGQRVDELELLGQLLFHQALLLQELAPSRRASAARRHPPRRRRRTPAPPCGRRAGRSRPRRRPSGA